MLSGLLFALVDDGFYEFLSWLALTVPIGTVLYYVTIANES